MVLQHVAPGPLVLVWVPGVEEAGGWLWYSPSQREGGEAQPFLVLQMDMVALGAGGLSPGLAFPTQAKGSGASGRRGQGGLPPGPTLPALKEAAWGGLGQC